MNTLTRLPVARTDRARRATRATDRARGSQVSNPSTPTARARRPPARVPRESHPPKPPDPPNRAITRARASPAPPDARVRAPVDDRSRAFRLPPAAAVARAHPPAPPARVREIEIYPIQRRDRSTHLSTARATRRSRVPRGAARRPTARADAAREKARGGRPTVLAVVSPHVRARTRKSARRDTRRVSIRRVDRTFCPNVRTVAPAAPAGRARTREDASRGRASRRARHGCVWIQVRHRGDDARGRRRRAAKATRTRRVAATLCRGPLTLTDVSRAQGRRSGDGRA